MKYVLSVERQNFAHISVMTIMLEATIKLFIQQMFNEIENNDIEYMHGNIIRIFYFLFLCLTKTQKIQKKQKIQPVHRSSPANMVRNKKENILIHYFIMYLPTKNKKQKTTKYKQKYNQCTNPPLLRW